MRNNFLRGKNRGSFCPSCHLMSGNVNLPEQKTLQKHNGLLISALICATKPTSERGSWQWTEARGGPSTIFHSRGRARPSSIPRLNLIPNFPFGWRESMVCLHYRHRSPGREPSHRLHELFYKFRPAATRSHTALLRCKRPRGALNIGSQTSNLFSWSF